ncbi:transcriptional regulator, partial [archaeon]
VEYSLTELGKSLIPLIKTTAKWGKEHRTELEELLVT